jgi:hypothetical protein
MTLTPAEVWLEEYKSLREEVLMRIAKQQEIAGFALALLAALAAVARFVSGTSSLSGTLKTVLPALPVVCSLLAAFTLMTLEYEMNIAQIYVYLGFYLRPLLSVASDAASIPGGDLSWSAERAIMQQGSTARVAVTGSMAAAKYVATVLPTLVFFAYFCVHTKWTGYALASAIVTSIFIVATVSAGVFTTRIYLRIGRAPVPT